MKLFQLSFFVVFFIIFFYSNTYNLKSMGGKSLMKASEKLTSHVRKKEEEVSLIFF